VSEIGHNNPPAFEAHSLNIEDLFASVSGAPRTVETDEQEQVLDDLLDSFRLAKKAADADRAAEKRPHDDAAKAVQAKWKPLLDRCDMAMVEVRKLLTPYREARQQAQAAAAAKAREEAAAKEAAARDALKSSEDLEERFVAEADLKQASKLVAVANKIERTPTGLRTRWTHRIVHRRNLLNHVIERYPEDLADMLNEFVRRKVASGTRDMPGVEITPEKQAA